MLNAYAVTINNYCVTEKHMGRLEHLLQTQYVSLCSVERMLHGTRVFIFFPLTLTLSLQGERE
jgi:hypothetical protein